ncbi:MAG TPA: hypothetical protein VGR06_35075, partial [Actinophytocola sp.]|nr:hypothetical protein [Actinophytocola sp.]
RLDESRQHPEHERRADPDREPPGRTGGPRDDPGPPLVGLLHERPGLVDQLGPDRAELDAPRGAGEEPGAELLLQAMDPIGEPLLAQAGLPQMVGR